MKNITHFFKWIKRIVKLLKQDIDLIEKILIQQAKP